MKKQRLLKLAGLLEKNAKNKKGMRFNLNVVITRSDRHRSNLFLDDPPKVDCGTTGCAMGLAGLSGKFKKQGLGFAVDGYGMAYLTWDKKSMDYSYAAMRLFDISYTAANFLFHPNSYTGRITGRAGELKVAKRIRKFVKHKGHTPTLMLERKWEI